MALNVKPVEHRYLWTIDIMDLPEEHQDAFRAFGMENEYDCIDYHDGDYHLKLDFLAAAKDQTSLEAMEPFIEEDDDVFETDYPFEEWRKHKSHSTFTDYLGWVLAMRYVVEQLSPEIVAENKIALWVWH